VEFAPNGHFHTVSDDSTLQISSDSPPVDTKPDPKIEIVIHGGLTGTSNIIGSSATGSEISFTGTVSSLRPKCKIEYAPKEENYEPIDTKQERNVKRSLSLKKKKDIVLDDDLGSRMKTLE
jgi:hypothetical protein